jgi:hypothetical protein
VTLKTTTILWDGTPCRSVLSVSASRRNVLPLFQGRIVSQPAKSGRKAEREKSSCRVGILIRAFCPGLRPDGEPHSQNPTKYFFGLLRSRWNVSMTYLGKTIFHAHIVLPCLTLAFCWFLSWITFRHWRWRQYVPPKRKWTSTALHNVASQKIILFKFILRYLVWTFESQPSTTISRALQLSKENNVLQCPVLCHH